MGRIATTIELAKSSWSVLKADKELLWLPALSGLASIVVIVTFVAPLTPSLAAGDELGTPQWALLGLMYGVLAFVTIFFNAALVSATHERLTGGDPTVGSALRGAGMRSGRILPWAVVSATVSLVLRALEERAGFIGRLMLGLAGLAWSLVTFLVLPVLVVEDVGVGEAISRSGRLFKRTWGENVSARVGFGLLGFVAVLPAVMIAVLLAGVGGAVAIVGLAAGVVWIVGVMLVMTALSGIFQTALYHYAVNGEVPGGFFEEQDFAAAFAPRRRWLH